MVQALSYQSSVAPDSLGAYRPGVTKNPATIAIIDDDESIRQSLRLLLRAADFNALTFASAEEYLEANEGEEHVDCLIVDVNLPGMSGVSLVRTLSDAGSSVPAILITARDDHATLEQIRRASSVPHLRKPFSDTALFETLALLLPH